MIYPDDFINKIIQGNCLEMIKNIPNNSIDLICIDPPYMTTKENWDKKEVVNEELSKELYRIAKDSCSLYCWCGIGEKSQSLIRWFPIFNKIWYFKDLITWKKQRGIGMRKGWLYTREECMWFVKNNKQFIWNKEEQYDLSDKRLFSLPNNKSEYKRWSNVWIDIKEEAGGMKSSPFHPTQKPIETSQRIIRVHTKKDGIVLDCFMGSGTTALACKQLGRNFIGIELEQQYVDVANERLKNENIQTTN